ncbi:conjugal transfer protein TraB [Burkholderia cenocepacia]|uniref:conjugal transfer protein TraB n=1 Tax=Burkholderia cenocepacia TaxID=95486 RepID=UPI002857F3F5|nr:conjugal transfer protein TraB [Burkholderia cenocepacia]MDR5645355.1 conjugal transfer protein TraB [Burkholderia cenocepacia]
MAGNDRRFRIATLNTVCGVTHIQREWMWSAAAGAAIARLAWWPGHWLWVLLALPAAWSMTRGRTGALVLWLAYYLTGARDIPVATGRFFSAYGELPEAGALALGYGVWISQAFLLSMPWVLFKPGADASFSCRAWRTIVPALLVTVPPIGIIGWLSPVYVASVLFPGWKLSGLILGIIALAAMATASRSSVARSGLALLVVLSTIANSGSTAPHIPPGWTPVDTALGRFDQSGYASIYARTQQVQSITNRVFASGADVVILPEEIVGLWRPSMNYWWRGDMLSFAATGRTLIIGADIIVATAPFRYTDSAVIAGANRGRVDSRQPVPLALWRPGAGVSAIRGSITQPYAMVAGKTVAFSICYEDLLWWPHWRLLVQPPVVLVSLSNSWFDSDLALAEIQRQGIEAVGRLAGAPLLRATNR